MSARPPPPAAGLLLALLVVACAHSEPPPPPGPDGDGGTASDGSSIPPGDTDGDGLCNDVEVMRGTDPGDPDTDRDGIDDFTESVAQMDPLDPTAPSPSVLVQLSEVSTSEATLVVAEAVDGDGEDYEGRFEERSIPGWDGNAGDFFVGHTALAASPESNVARIEPLAARFRGVLGPTELFFELTFRFGGNTPLGCVRGYPFRYRVRRSDGSSLPEHLLLLLVAPPDVEITADAFCPQAVTCP